MNDQEGMMLDNIPKEKQRISKVRIWKKERTKNWNGWESFFGNTEFNVRVF